MRRNLAALALAVAFLSAAAPAGAQAIDRSVTQYATGQSVGTGFRPTIVFECAVAAVADAAAANIKECYLVGSSGYRYDADTLVHPGPASATASGATSVPLQSYRVCVVSEVTWLDGSRTSHGPHCG